MFRYQKRAKVAGKRSKSRVWWEHRTPKDAGHAGAEKSNATHHTDEGKPACQRCQKGKFDCEGYSIKVQWIDQSQTASRSRSRRSPNTGRDTAVTQLIKKTPSPFTLDCYVAFTNQRLFGSGAESPEHNHEFLFTSILQDSSTHVSYTALKCLATTYFGRMQRRSDIMSQGAHLYSKSLLQLNRAIEDPTTAYDPRNVAATIALTHYETIIYTDKYGWIQHAGGTGRLLEMRGPDHAQDEPAHSYFLLSRFRTLCQATVSRKRCFLERPEWQTVPWAKHPHTKTPADQLVDLFAHVPAIFQEYDRLSGLAGVTPATAQATFELSGRAAGPEQEAWDIVRNHVGDLLKRLEDWRVRWGKARGGGVVAVERSIDPATSLTWDPSIPFPPSKLRYSDFERAYEVALYIIVWATLVPPVSQLRDGMGLLAFLEAEPEPEQDLVGKDLLQLPTSLVKTTIVVEVACRSFDYLLAERHRGKGAFTVMILLRICFLFFIFDKDPPKVRWAIQTFERLSDATGFALSRNMDALEVLGTEGTIGTKTQHLLVQKVREDMKGSRGEGGGEGGKEEGSSEVE